MSIVSSVIGFDAAQRDGRRSIQEIHTDHLGVQYSLIYLAPAVWDREAALAARAVQMVLDLRDAEISQNISNVMANGSLAVTTTLYSTPVQNFAAGRAAYQNATRVEAIMMGDFLSSLTNGQLQTAFGMTAGQVTTLRTNKLTPAATAAATIRASTGA